MKNRVAQLKRARENHVSKYARRWPRSAVNIKVAPKPTAGNFASQPTPYYNPARHYDEQSPGGIPSYFLLSRSSVSSSQSSTTVSDRVSSEILDEFRYSDKEVVTSSGMEVVQGSPELLVSETTGISEAELERRNSDGQILTDVNGMDIDTSLAESNDTSAARDALPEEPSKWPPADYSSPLHTMGDNTTSAPHPGLKRSRSQLSSIRSIRSRHSIGSISARSMVSRLSKSFSHVESVLSMTNSWRSSLVYAMSIASSQDPLTRDECLSWDALVDESKFVSKPGNHLELEAKSLRTRPCCEFFENDLEKRSKCDICGFSEMHHLARTSLSDDGGLIDGSVIDRFGNTPLHHAAAAGNTVRILQLISSAGQAQNTSGETYLHVLWLGVNERFSEYIDILTKASSLGFDFSIRDYIGDTAAVKLRKAVLSWRLGFPQQWEISQVMKRPEDISSPTNVTELEARSVLSLTPPEPPSELSGCRVPDYFGSPVTPVPDYYRSPVTPVKEQKKQGFPLNVLNIRRDKSAEVESMGIDLRGDTILISTLKNWSVSPKSSRQLEKIIRQDQVHMRDRRGYTALAIAVRYGLRDAASLLLKHGANPNTRSYEKTSVVEHAAQCMAQAQMQENERLYAKILSCMVLLADYGGKAKVTVYDEFTVPRSSAKKRPKSSHAKLTQRQLQTSLGIIEEDIDEASSKSELADTSISPARAELAEQRKIKYSLYLPPRYTYHANQSTEIEEPRMDEMDSSTIGVSTSDARRSHSQSGNYLTSSGNLSSPLISYPLIPLADAEFFPFLSHNDHWTDYGYHSIFSTNRIGRLKTTQSLLAKPSSIQSNYARRTSPEDYFKGRETAELSKVPTARLGAEKSVDPDEPDPTWCKPKGASIPALNNPVPTKYQLYVPQAGANLLSGTKADTLFSLHYPSSNFVNSRQTSKGDGPQGVSDYIPQPGPRQMISSWDGTSRPSRPAEVQRRQESIQRSSYGSIQSPKSFCTSKPASPSPQNTVSNTTGPTKQTKLLDLESGRDKSSRKEVCGSQFQDSLKVSCNSSKKRRLNSDESSCGGCDRLLRASRPSVGRGLGRPMMVFGNSSTHLSSGMGNFGAFGTGTNHGGVGNYLDNHNFNFHGEYSAQGYPPAPGNLQIQNTVFDIRGGSLEGGGAETTEPACLSTFPPFPAYDIGNPTKYDLEDRRNEDIEIVPNLYDISGAPNRYHTSSTAALQSSFTSYESSSSSCTGSSLPGNLPSQSINLDQPSERTWMPPCPVVPSGAQQFDAVSLLGGGAGSESSAIAWPITQIISSQNSSHSDKSECCQFAQQSNGGQWGVWRREAEDTGLDENCGSNLSAQDFRTLGFNSVECFPMFYEMHINRENSL